MSRPALPMGELRDAQHESGAAKSGAIVVVGAGQAGGWAATTMRERGY